MEKKTSRRKEENTYERWIRQVVVRMRRNRKLCAQLGGNKHIETKGRNQNGNVLVRSQRCGPPPWTPLARSEFRTAVHGPRYGQDNEKSDPTIFIPARTKAREDLSSLSRKRKTTSCSHMEERNLSCAKKMLDSFHTPTLCI